LALLIGGAFSQEATFHSQSNVVVIPALVKSAKGDVVYGLGAKDFVVEDDGVEQAVRLDEAAEGSAVSVVVAIQRGRRANYEFPRIRGLSAMLDPIIESGRGRWRLSSSTAMCNWSKTSAAIRSALLRTSWACSPVTEARRFWMRWIIR